MIYDCLPPIFIWSWIASLTLEGDEIFHLLGDSKVIWVLYIFFFNYFLLLIFILFQIFSNTFSSLLTLNVFYLNIILILPLCTLFSNFFYLSNIKFSTLGLLSDIRNIFHPSTSKTPNNSPRINFSPSTDSTEFQNIFIFVGFSFYQALIDHQLQRRANLQKIFS